MVGGGPGSPGEAPCAVCQPCEELGRAVGPSLSTCGQAFDAASLLRFLSEEEWRRAGQTSKAMRGSSGSAFSPSPQCSGGPGQGVAGSKSSCMDEDLVFVKDTIARRLHIFDESFDSGEAGFLGDELVCWELCGGTRRHYPDEEVAKLEAWLEILTPQAEGLVQLVTELSVCLSQEQSREAWAALESELRDLRRAASRFGSPACYEAAGSLELLGKLLDQHWQQIQGWDSALLAWKAAGLGASAFPVWPSRFGDQMGRGGCSSSGRSSPC